MTYERCLVGPGKHAASYRRWVLRRGRGCLSKLPQAHISSGVGCSQRAKDSTRDYPSAEQLWAKTKRNQVQGRFEAGRCQWVVIATSVGRSRCVKDVVVIK